MLKIRQAIVIAAKPPIPGRVKTRLSPPLSLKESAGLYECFLIDTINILSSIKEVDRFIAFYPESSRAYFLSTSLEGFTLITQRGKDLGERIAGVFETLFTSGYDSVTIVGSDAPTLPVDFIKRSFNDLKGRIDLTIGPCRDGGYYLLGLKAFYRELFEEMFWSSPSVLKETLKRADELGLKVSILPKWYDIDDDKDLTALKGDLSSCPKDVAPRTKDFIVRLLDC